MEERRFLFETKKPHTRTNESYTSLMFQKSNKRKFVLKSSGVDATGGKDH